MNRAHGYLYAIFYCWRGPWHIRGYFSFDLVCFDGNRDYYFSILVEYEKEINQINGRYQNWKTLKTPFTKGLSHFQIGWLWRLNSLFWRHKRTRIESYREMRNFGNIRACPDCAICSCKHHMPLTRAGGQAVMFFSRRWQDSETGAMYWFIHN